MVCLASGRINYCVHPHDATITTIFIVRISRRSTMEESEFTRQAENVINLRDSLLKKVEELDLLSLDPESLDGDIKKLYFNVKRFTAENELAAVTTKNLASQTNEANRQWNGVSDGRKVDIYNSILQLGHASDKGILDQFKVNIPVFEPPPPPADLPPVASGRRIIGRPPPPPSAGLEYDESASPKSDSQTSPLSRSNYKPLNDSKQKKSLESVARDGTNQQMAVFSDDSPYEPSPNTSLPQSIPPLSQGHTPYIPPTYSGTYPKPSQAVPNSTNPMTNINMNAYQRPMVQPDINQLQFSQQIPGQSFFMNNGVPYNAFPTYSNPTTIGTPGGFGMDSGTHRPIYGSGGYNYLQQTMTSNMSQGYEKSPYMSMPTHAANPIAYDPRGRQKRNLRPYNEYGSPTYSDRAP